MIVYRVGWTKYAEDLTGEGARLHGGRWNHELTACIYTSESRALAILEYTVNVNIDDIPPALSITGFEIPDNEIRTIRVADLPGNWKSFPIPSSTKDMGSRLLKAIDHLLIKIPSVIVPDEHNYLINPAHPGIRHCKIAMKEDFVYDVRIKGV